MPFPLNFHQKSPISCESSIFLVCFRSLSPIFLKKVAIFLKNIIFAASHLKGEKYGRDYHWQTSRAVLLEKHLRFFIHVFLLCLSSQCTGTNTCIIWQTKPLLLLTRMKSVNPPRERIFCKNLMAVSSGSKFVNTPPPSWC